MSQMNLPNKLTVARCIMAVIFVVLMSFEHYLTYLAAYVVFVLAAITDYYDGKIARERNLITNFGKLLDPVADKVLVVSAFIMMVTIPELRVPGWAIVAILAREFLITGARSLAAAEGIVIAANKYGKTKTVLQLIYVFVFLFMAIVLEFLGHYEAIAKALPVSTQLLAEVIGYASLLSIIFIAAYTVYSGWQYARLNWAALKLDELS